MHKNYLLTKDFQDAETVDVGLIIAGSGDGTHVDNLITIAEKEKTLLSLLVQKEQMLLMFQTLIHKLKMLKTFLILEGHLVIVYLIVVINKCMIDIQMFIDLFLNGDIAVLCARTDLLLIHGLVTCWF